MLKSVLFDLDDTLFDHHYSSRCGLAAVQQDFECFQEIPLDELLRDYTELLNESHPKVLQGALSLEESRVDRFYRLFSQVGEEVSPIVAQFSVERYQKAYRAARRPVPGAIHLLRNLKPIVKMAVVTNNLVREQREKLEYCGLSPFVDHLVVSEEVGAAKPEPTIFQAALERLHCDATEAVMVGDSWDDDILGAYGVGIRAIWLNRFLRPCPDQTIASEINSFEAHDEVMDLILRGT